jgi:hypothetical protein
MQSSATRLSASKFADDHIDAYEADGFVADLVSNSVPRREFAKDTEQVKGAIRRVKLQTKRGASIFVPPDMYDDGSFEISGGEDGESTVMLRDKITRMTGASGPKAESE